MSFDVLQEKIIRMKNPTVVGLDPKPEYVPEHIRKASYEQFGETFEGAADAIFQFNKGLIDALCDIVPAVKPQSAYYERLGWPGMSMLEKTIRYAHEKGMYVIADIKRGDIGSTAEAYADAWLGVTKVGEALCGGFNADCVTLNGYMGADSVNPFLKVAGERDKSVFILAKTSNPGSGELQNVAAGEGDTVYGLMADLIEKWGAGTEGKHGYTRAGAVAGATYPEELQKLRARMPHTFLLVPGYGAQGGTAEDVQYAFQENGRGAVVNSSRGIICPGRRRAKTARTTKRPPAPPQSPCGTTSAGLSPSSKPRKQRGTHPCQYKSSVPSQRRCASMNLPAPSPWRRRGWSPRGRISLSM